MRRISLDELMERHPNYSYEQHRCYIIRLLAEQKLMPVKNAKSNGKKPALLLAYWVLEEEQLEEALEKELKDELSYQLVPKITIDYYLSHVKEYQKDRVWVLMLNQYLKTNQELLEQPESVNERSFEIWNREKFLSKEQGKKILKRCGISLDDFKVYETAEPIPYYSNTRKTPQKMLILENKDTFFSMRKFLLDGHTRILGEEIGTLIYGGGKRIVKSFQEFDLSVEPYMQFENNTLYYFGDLDYEGIGIYESLRNRCQENRIVVPFVAAYERMLAKADQADSLPDTKEQQNRNLTGIFFSYFSRETAERMQEILKQGQYIPQEILNSYDF